MKTRLIISFVVLSAVIFVYACGGSQTTAATGNEGADVYNNNCLICHGADGKAGMSGASDLSVSVLSHEAAVDVVTNGRNGMRAFTELSKEQIEAVVKHIETLRK